MYLRLGGDGAMRRVCGGALVGLFLLGGGACSGGDPEVIVPPQQVSPQLEEIFEAICDLSFRCCTRGEIDYFVAPYVDEASCVDRLMGQAALTPVAATDLSALAGLGESTIIIPNLGALDEAARDFRLFARTNAISECAAYIASLECNEPESDDDEACTPPPPPADETPCDLDKLFSGLLDEGAECTSVGFSLECAEGLICSPGLGLGVEGRCVAARKQGQPCFSTLECDTGLSCTELDGTCQRPRDEGEVCVFADRNDPAPDPATLLLGCRADLSCDPVTSTCVAACQPGAQCVVDEQCDEEQELSCIVGRCGLPRGEGLPCLDNDDCETPLTCTFDPLDPSQTVCSKGKGEGAACSFHEECASAFCNPDTLRCAQPVPPGSLCLSGDDAECADGVCVFESPGSFCADNQDCPLSGVCDPFTSQCASYCIPAKPAGATCLSGDECVSGACIAGFCRDLPLQEGEPCESSLQCETEFCSYEDEPTCLELPLPLGANCFSHFECDSEVCFPASPELPPSCTSGLDEGEPCTDPTLPPCNPKKFFCDLENEDPPVCVPLKETGEICKTSVECRGECTINHGRNMCSPATAEDRALCDGSDRAGEGDD